VPQLKMWQCHSQVFDGLFEPYSVQSGFFKDWKSKYTEQFGTSCPWWLVLLILIAYGFWMKEKDKDCQNQIKQKILASSRAGDATISKKL